jgi:hypothetical protein
MPRRERTKCRISANFAGLTATSTRPVIIEPIPRTAEDDLWLRF